MKISIPNPCHENWDKMSPNEKGRHCLSCAKTVVDFSNESAEDIKSFFKRNTGNICGRFSLNQLKKPITNSFSLFKKHFNTRISKFAFALYLVFGGFLFSCSNDRATLGEPNVEHIKGDIVSKDEHHLWEKLPTHSTSDTIFDSVLFEC